ncbi:MAG TPA: nitroreductase [Acidimicrobiaceae bacterium]|nr:nitroreductase [Actinomycetota bacterium]MDG1198250.1 nitroreductase [Actinomycetota bacterium]MDG2120646.1 nitroreductase [Actinomycetota bacterium]HAN08156.1 nitroreductase [Acidimicrobiaceae bacterium]
MDFETLVKQRRSIRGYKPDAVSKEIIDEIIEIAKRAPSSMNTQPWHFHVITGDPLEQIRKGNTERMLAGASVDREIKMGHGYEGIHRDRQVEIAIQLFSAMEIERDDKERRQDWVMRGFRQFDAPVSIVVTLDKALEHDTVGHFDLGAATYGLVLAAWTKGLGSVINGQGIMQSSVVREFANIPEDEVIMTCVAMGYPDETFVANDVQSLRASNESVVSYVGFDE